MGHGGTAAGRRDSARRDPSTPARLPSLSRHSALPAAAAARPAVLQLPGPGLDPRLLAPAFERLGLALVSVPVGGAPAALTRRDCAALLAERASGGEELAAALGGSERADVPALVVVDAYGGTESGAQQLARAAAEVVALPATPEQIAGAVQRAVRARSLAAENRALRQALDGAGRLGALLSSDRRMLEVFATVDAVAAAGVPILLRGESGTGKSELALAIHRASDRATGPLVEVNCGALPSGLIESELFGHAKGAFTGALRERAGRFESAHRGTLFLDELPSAPLDLQVKLLRALETGQITRVGEDHARAVDVRVIAATQKDLAPEIAAGRFREDLYWRLNVLALELPPLRERPGDVPLLAESFVARFAARHARPIERVGSAALARLMAASWPGNVRQLAHEIERAVLLSAGPELDPAAFSRELARPAAGGAPTDSGAEAAPEPPAGPLAPAVAAAERALIARALEECGGRRALAARRLGLHRSTLFNKMRKYGLAGTDAGS
jgi:two-component system response regulator HydG